MDDAREIVQRAVLKLKEKLSLYDYRVFLKVVHFHVFRLVEVNGVEKSSRFLNKGDENYATVAIQTDSADQLMYLLGYEDVIEVPELIMVRDYQSSLPRLRAFCQVAEEEIPVTKGDPLSLQPLPPSADAQMTAAYLIYHLHIQIQLIVYCTANHMLGLIEDQICRSMECVEDAAGRLGILKPSSHNRQLWEKVKITILGYLASRGELHSSRDVDEEIQTVAGAIMFEIRALGHVSNVVYPILPFLQNLQALIANSSDWEMLDAEDSATFLRNSLEIPHDLFSDQFVESLEKLGALVAEATSRSLSPEEIERVHVTAIWQAEYFLSDLKINQVLVSEQRAPQMQESSERAPPPEQTSPDEREQSVQEVLDVLKATVGYIVFRNFVKVVHYAVQKLFSRHDSGLGNAFAVNKREPNFATVAALTDVGENLMYMLGFIDVEMIPDSLVMLNFRESEPMLRAFLKVGNSVLAVSRPDPAIITSFETMENVPALVAHLAYHLELRCHLLSIHSVPHMLPAVENDLRVSIAAIDELGHKLKVLVQSGSRRLWNTTKQNIIKYVKSPDGEQRRPLHDEICGIGERLVDELSEFVPFELIALLGYSSMVTAATGITSTGEMISPDAIQNYIRCHRQLMCRCTFFSEKYKETGTEVFGLMEKAQRRTLTEDDIARVYLLSAWQAENFLTSFCPGAIDLDHYVPAREHMASMLGMDLSSLMQFQTHEPSAEPTVHATCEIESDGEEKMDASEKEVSNGVNNKTEEGNCSTSEDICPTVSIECSSSGGVSICQMSNGNTKTILALLKDESQWDPDLLEVATAELRQGGKLAPLLRYELSLQKTRWLTKLKLARSELEELTAACDSADMELIQRTLSEARIQAEKKMLRMLSILQHIGSLLGPLQLEEIGNETIVVLLYRILGHHRQNPSSLFQLSSQFKSELFRGSDT